MNSSQNQTPISLLSTATTGLSLTGSSNPSVYNTQPSSPKHSCCQTPFRGVEDTMNVLLDVCSDLIKYKSKCILDAAVKYDYSSAALSVKDHSSSNFHHESIEINFASYMSKMSLYNILETPEISLKFFVDNFIPDVETKEGRSIWQENANRAMIAFFFEAYTNAALCFYDVQSQRNFVRWFNDHNRGYLPDFESSSINCYFSIRVPATYLVGIETNPGPTVNRNMQNFMAQNLELYEKNRVRFWTHYQTCHRSITYEAYCSLIVNDCQFRRAVSRFTGIRKSTLVLIAFHSYNFSSEPTLFARTDNGFLVNVETNPGPTCLSTLSLKSFKRGQFVPQGWFDVGVDDKTVNVLQNFADSIGKIAEHPSVFKVEHSAPLIENLFEKVSKSLPSFSQCTHLLVVFAAFTIAMYCSSIRVHKAAIVTLISAYVAIKYTDNKFTDLINKIIDFVFQLDDPDDVVQAQVGKESIVPLVLGYFYASSACVSYDKNNISTFVKTLGDAPKLRDGISFFLDYVLEAIQSFSNFITDKMSLDPLVIKSTMFPEIDVLYRDLNKLTTKLREGAPYNYDNAMVLFEIEKRANNIFASIPNSREFAEYKRSAMSLNAIIKPLVARMERNNITGNGPRREPLAIMLGGPSGVGKSTSIIPLILAVNSLVLPEEKLEGFISNHNDYIWNFIPENPFFDSYHGQFNCIIDEAGAQRDSAGVADPGALGAMRMINTANFPLHMANLEDKGNCNFTSELVFATTNRTFFDWKSMYLSEAYTRRFKMSYLHVPKVEYCKEGSITDNLWDRRLDNAKIPQHDDGFVMSINEFFPYDYLNGKVVGHPLGFDELVLHLANTYKSHKSHGDNLLNFHQIQKNRYIEMRKQFHAQSGPKLSDLLAENFGLTKDFVVSCLVNSKERFDLSVDGLNRFWKLASYEMVKDLDVQALDNWFLSIENLVFSKKFFLAMSTVAVTLLIVWKFVRPFLFPQSGSVRKAKKHNVRPSRVAVLSRNAAPQAGISHNAYDISMKIMRNNVYHMSVVAASGARQFGYLTFLSGRLAMMPEHFSFTIDDMIEEQDCDPNPIIRLRRVGSPEVGFDVMYNDMSLVAFDDSKNDVIYVNFPRVIHNHVNIAKFFSDDDETAKFDSVLLRNVNGVYTMSACVSRVTGSVSYGDYTTDSSYTYPIATKIGECGALLMSCGSQDKPVIRGIHIAGDGYSGMSTKVYKHHIDAAISMFLPEVEPEFSSLPESKAQVGASFLAIAEVPKLRTAMKNQVIPSVLHESWGVSDYAPSALRAKTVDGIKHDPWVNARSKYSCVSPAHNMFLLESVVQHTISEMNHAIVDSPWKPRVFSFEEAVEGIAAVPFCESIPRNTSSGYPFCLDIKMKGKKDFFGDDQDYSFDSDKCKQLVESISNQIKHLESGGRLDVKFADYLKDERRKKEKVFNCKTRLISASPIDFLIICKMYFGDFVRSVMTNRISNSCAVGINPYSYEWDVLARHLNSVGQTKIFGDFSGYDGSLNQTLEYAGFDIIESFYFNATDSERQVRKGLFEDIVNSRHVTTGPSDSVSTLYEWFGSNPSGNFLTTILNSLCNILAIKYTIVNVLGKEEGFHHLSIPDDFVVKVVSSLSENVRIIVFGDDNGISLSDQMAAVTQAAMTQSFLDIGFVYTDEGKTGEVLSHRVLQQCSFLKRGFQYDVEIKRYLAPLELAVILEMPYWTKTTAPAGSVESTVETALMELSLHGLDTFNKYSPVIKQACISKMQFAPNTSYRFNRSKAMMCDGFY